MSAPRPSAYRALVGADSAIHEVLDALPLQETELLERLDALRAQGGRVEDAHVAFLQRANRLAALLNDLPAPRTPAELAQTDAAALVAPRVTEECAARLQGLLEQALTPVAAPAALRRGDALDLCREQVVAACEARLRNTAAGDLLAAGLAPRQAPAEADWAAVALEELEERGGLALDDARGSRGTFRVGPIGRTPGWLWARIRGEVRGRVLTMRRRRTLVRTALAAAGLLASALVYVIVSSRGNADADQPVIVFQRVDQPLSDQFSTTAMVRRMRDVR